MKRRDFERHLRSHSATPLRAGGDHSYWGFDPGRSTAVPATARLTSASRARSASNSTCRLLPGRADRDPSGGRSAETQSAAEATASCFDRCRLPTTSGRGEPTGQSTQAGAGTSPLLRAWWAGWLSSGLLLNALLQFRIDVDPKDIPALKLSSLAIAGWNVLAIVAALLAIAVVHLTTRRLDARGAEARRGSDYARQRRDH